MEINKLEKDLFEKIKLSLRNYLIACYKIPTNIDVDNLNIKRIRYVKEWGLNESAFIIEVGSSRFLLSFRELGFTTEEFIILIKEQNQNGLLLIKSIITHQEWYEYPVIWGNIDNTFDDNYLYDKDGKYGDDNYINFGKLYG